jgi:hypothetical protein
MVQNYIQENLPEIYSDVTDEKVMNEKTGKYW